MSDARQDGRHQPWADYRPPYATPPVSHQNHTQGGGEGGVRHVPRPYQHQQPPPASEYAAYGSPSFPLFGPPPPVQQRYQQQHHFQAQPQPLAAWPTPVPLGAGGAPLHLPPIRQADERAAQPYHSHQPRSLLRTSTWTFPDPPRAEDAPRRRDDDRLQAEYRSAPRESESWQGHDRTHSYNNSHSHSQSQPQSSIQHLEYQSPVLSDEGPDRRWAGLGDEQPSREAEHEPAPVDTVEDTDSEEDETGKKKRKRRRKANEVPRDMSQRKYCCRQCSKSFARPSALTTHERSHSKDRPCICPAVNCRRGFSVPSNLRRHQRLHGHPDPEPSLGPTPPVPIT